MNCKLLRIKAVDHRFTTVPTRQILYPLATTTMQKGEQDGEEGEEGEEEDEEEEEERRRR
jgi:hypothetical protein